MSINESSVLVETSPKKPKDVLTTDEFLTNDFFDTQKNLKPEYCSNKSSLSVRSETDYGDRNSSAVESDSHEMNETIFSGESLFKCFRFESSRCDENVTKKCLAFWKAVNESPKLHPCACSVMNFARKPLPKDIVNTEEECTDTWYDVLLEFQRLKMDDVAFAASSNNCKMCDKDHAYYKFKKRMHPTYKASELQDDEDITCLNDWKPLEKTDKLLAPKKTPLPPPLEKSRKCITCGMVNCKCSEEEEKPPFNPQLSGSSEKKCFKCGALNCTCRTCLDPRIQFQEPDLPSDSFRSLPILELEQLSPEKKCFKCGALNCNCRTCHDPRIQFHEPELPRSLQILELEQLSSAPVEIPNKSDPKETNRISKYCSQCKLDGCYCNRCNLKMEDAKRAVQQEKLTPLPKKSALSAVNGLDICKKCHLKNCQCEICDNDCDVWFSIASSGSSTDKESFKLGIRIPKLPILQKCKRKEKSKINETLSELKEFLRIPLPPLTRQESPETHKQPSKPNDLERTRRGSRVEFKSSPGSQTSICTPCGKTICSCEFCGSQNVVPGINVKKSESYATVNQENESRDDSSLKYLSSEICERVSMESSSTCAFCSRHKCKCWDLKVDEARHLLDNLKYNSKFGKITHDKACSTEKGDEEEDEDADVLVIEEKKQCFICGQSACSCKTTHKPNKFNKLVNSCSFTEARLLEMPQSSETRRSCFESAISRKSSVRQSMVDQEFINIAEASMLRITSSSKSPKTLDGSEADIAGPSHLLTWSDLKDRTQRKSTLANVQGTKKLNVTPEQRAKNMVIRNKNVLRIDKYGVPQVVEYGDGRFIPKPVTSSEMFSDSSESLVLCATQKSESMEMLRPWSCVKKDDGTESNEGSGTEMRYGRKL